MWIVHLVRLLGNAFRPAFKAAMYGLRVGKWLFLPFLGDNGFDTYGMTQYFYHLRSGIHKQFQISCHL